jgi:CheY-like chemotaxis protein
MSDTEVIPAKVLFVDDDLSFLQMLRDVFGNASGGAWDMQTATSGGEALQRLRAKATDLAVIDVFMPGMDGLQLLRVLNVEYPSLPKVLLTGMPDGNTREQALEGGAALFLEKPASAAGYDSVFATLNELLRWHQRFSTRGALKRLTLLDLVKLECKSGNSRLFEVFAGNVRGEIYIKEGVIIHAIMPDRRGQSAFTFLTTALGAVFYLRQYVEPIERSVDRQWEFLVMESAHVLAQLAETPPLPEEPPAAEAAPDAPPVQSPPVIPPALSSMPPSTPKPDEPPMIKMAAPVPPALSQPAVAPSPFVSAPLPEPAVRPRIPKAGSPAPTRLETQGDGDLVLNPAPDALPLETVPDPGGFKVEELVLCLEFRDVLHATNCLDSNKRMQLADVLLQKLRVFATQLPLGDLDRVELNSTGNRMVIRYDSRRCLLVRTNTRLTQPAGNLEATEPAEEWLARHPGVNGVLAAAVLTSDGRLFCRSFGNDFPIDVTQAIAREAARLPELALKHSFPAWCVRGLYSRAQLYAFRRVDGAVLVAFLPRSGIDRAAVETFYAEFGNVRAV